MIEVKIGNTTHMVRTRADVTDVSRLMVQAIDEAKAAREAGEAKASEWTRADGGTWRIHTGRWQTRRDRATRSVLPPVDVWTMGAKVGLWHLIPAGSLRSACKWDVSLVERARVSLERPGEWVCPLCGAP